jgi:hypothetical protein
MPADNFPKSIVSGVIIMDIEGLIFVERDTAVASE